MEENTEMRQLNAGGRLDHLCNSMAVPSSFYPTDEEIMECLDTGHLPVEERRETEQVWSKTHVGDLIDVSRFSLDEIAALGLMLARHVVEVIGRRASKGRYRVALCVSPDSQPYATAVVRFYRLQKGEEVPSIDWPERKPGSPFQNNCNAAFTVQPQE